MNENASSTPGSTPPGSTPPGSKFDANEADGGHSSIDEQRLQSDAVYRFNYVAEVIGLGKDDSETLQSHHQLLEPHLASIVDDVYEKMFQYPAMKRHFLPRHSGYEGKLADSMDELHLGHEQAQFRKKRLKQYFATLATAEWDATFAVLIDLAGYLHTQKKGNSNLDVPIVQILALMGFMNDHFIQKISGLGLPAESELKLVRAYSKLFWVQASMFIRHYTN